MSQLQRTTVVPGDGIVARYGDVLAVVVAPQSADAAAVTAFLAAVERASVSDGAADATFDALATLGPGGPATAVVVVAASVSIAVLGDVSVRVASPGTELLLNGAGATEPRTRTVGEAVESILIGDASADFDAPWFDLVDGVVPGAGLALRLDSADVGAQPAPVVDPGDGADGEPAPFDAISLIGIDGDDVPSTPLPIEPEPSAVHVAPAPPTAGDEVIVNGVRCRHGHFNHPDSANCVWCGLGMLQDSYVLVPGARPPLGVLVVNETATYTLDRDYVIGRSPSRDPLVQSDQARPLALQDPDRSVSRVHASVVLDGWDVSVVDRGSANGTGVRDRGVGDWERAPTSTPRVLRPGSQIRVGPHVLTFHSHHVR